MIKVIRKYRFVTEDCDRHGNLRCYLRMKGKPKVRLWQLPGTPEFDAEYRSALSDTAKAKISSQKSVAKSGSLRAFCTAYYGSAEFKRMEPQTQHVRRLILDKLCDRHGDKPAGLMEPKHVRRLRDERAEKPAVANSIVKALRAVFQHAVRDEVVKRNPAAGVEYLRSGSEGFHTWTIEEIEQFEARHPIGSKARLAMALALYLGQRRSDVVRLGRQHLRSDGRLHFIQHKNRNRKPVPMALPVIPELRRIIDASPCGDLAFLVSERGTPYTADSLTNRFRIWCRQAGLDHCSLHGLRKAAGTRLADLGASVHVIAAILGHRSLRQVQHYTVAADQRRLATAGMALVTEQMTTDQARSDASTEANQAGEAEQIESKVSHLSDQSAEWDKIGPQPIEKKRVQS